MNEIVIHQCRTFNKTFRTKQGNDVTSPPCGCVYCPRCHNASVKKHLNKMPHNRITVNAYHNYLVLPYYAEIPATLKNKLNRAFLQDLKRKYGAIAYLHGLEKQNGHLHVNYYMLSDEQLDEDFIREKWSKWLLKHTKQTLKAAKDVYVKPVNDHKHAAEYIVKYFRKEAPHEYLPERGRYWRTYYTSRNFQQFCDERSEDELLKKLMETLEGDTTSESLSSFGQQPELEGAPLAPVPAVSKKETHNEHRPRRTHSKVAARLQARTRSPRRRRPNAHLPLDGKPRGDSSTRSSDAPRIAGKPLNRGMEDDTLDAEMRLYHNCFTLAKCYHLDDDTAANEAKGCLNLFVQQCEQGHDPKDVAAIIYEEFDEYLKSW